MCANQGQINILGKIINSHNLRFSVWGCSHSNANILNNLGINFWTIYFWDSKTLYWISNIKILNRVLSYLINFLSLFSDLPRPCKPAAFFVCLLEWLKFFQIGTRSFVGCKNIKVVHLDFLGLYYKTVYSVYYFCVVVSLPLSATSAQVWYFRSWVVSWQAKDYVTDIDIHIRNHIQNT
jgi:hypothetical protein